VSKKKNKDAPVSASRMLNSAATFETLVVEALSADCTAASAIYQM